MLPLCFICYAIAYIDRSNVSLAKLTMVKDLPGFDEAVFGVGMGVFFLGYFLLGILVLAGAMVVSATVVFFLGLGRRSERPAGRLSEEVAS
jgi:hypothetical protein